MALALCAILALAFAGRASATTGVLLSSLPTAFVVTAQVNGVEVTNTSNPQLVYLQDTLTVEWRLNESFVGQDGAFLQVLTRVCYGLPSTKGRAWRMPNNDLLRDRQCYTTIDTTPYPPPTTMTVNGVTVPLRTVSWIPGRSIPGAQYFVRVFALNSADSSASIAWNAAAYGQNSNNQTTSNLMTVIPYSGVTISLDIVVIVLSLASYALLFGIFFAEKRFKKNK